MKQVKYEVIHFPDGEVQAKLTEPIDRKESYELKIRITNANELFIADQLMDILDRHEVNYSINIPYLMGMRMDRIMDFERPFTLKLVASVFNKHNPTIVRILEPHSNRTCQLIKNSLPRPFRENKTTLIDRQLLVPDFGAAQRYDILCVGGTIYGTKVRDEETGKILSIDIKNPEEIGNRKIVIIDDLCDGGGTFVGLLEVVKKYKPDAKVDLYVTHAVNKDGIKKVCSAFNHVYITDSYKDWVSDFGDEIPNNLTVFSVFKSF